MVPTASPTRANATCSARPLLGVVLAGGRSSRMRCDKATLAHPGGLTFLEHAIWRLSQVTPHVAVSGRPVTQENILEIPDQTPVLGPAMAVWSAVQVAARLKFSSILVTPLDMPDLEPKHLQALIDAATGHWPTCASFDGQSPHPLVAVYPVSLMPELEVVANSQRRSLRAWLATCPSRLVLLPEHAKRDCNTPQDITASIQP